MRRGMEERLCQDGFHDPQSWCAETALKVQVVAHCPTAEMWRTTVGECRFLFASCSKVVKWRHFCCSFMFDLIDLHFHSVLIYALCLWLYSPLAIENPRMRHEPWVFFWQTPAKQMILATLGVAMRTRPFGRSQVIVFELSPFSLNACKSFFLNQMQCLIRDWEDSDVFSLINESFLSK